MDYRLNFSLNETGYSAEFEFGKLTVSGDETAGFRPYQLMIASIAGCSGGVLRKILKKQRLEIQDIQIDVRVTRSDSQVKRIESIHMHFIISGANLNETKIGKAASLARKYCSMVQSVRGCITITESFEVLAA